MPRIAIITTDPHGAQILHETDGEKESNASQEIGNRLYTLRSVGQRQNGFNVTMTGEELTSLAIQWLTIMHQYDIKCALCRKDK
jgi:hypothetical protein